MELQDLKPGVVVLGLLSEPCIIDAVAPVSSAVVRIVATGRESGATVQRVLHLGQIAKLQSARTGEHFHGDASRFRLGVEAHTVSIPGRLNIAQRTPTSTADTAGSLGDIAADDDYVYVKTSDGWKRAALSTW